MRLETSLNLKISQEMVLSPRMIQSMEILQLPVMALEEKLQQALEENPVLELKQDEENPNQENEASEPGPLAEESMAEGPERELVIDSKGQGEEDFERLEAIPEDWRDSLYDDHRPSRSAIESLGDSKHDAEQNIASRPESLEDYLIAQLAFFDLKAEERSIVQQVIASLDEGGYLKSTAEEIASQLDPRPEIDQVEDGIDLVQQLEPRGVGAHTLEECLLLQLDRDTPDFPAVRVLIQNHLEDIRHNRVPLIQKATSFTIPRINEAVLFIRKLNPKPGTGFSEQKIPYVVPDIEIQKTPDGEYSIRLTDDWLPDVQVNKNYIQDCKNRATDPKVKEFLRPKIQSAQWLLEAIEQRRNTLRRVTQAIVQKQKAFLDQGMEFIEPLKMQQIADEVGVDVSTISRAVDEKWIQTPRGIFTLKRFFGGGTQTATGEEIAYERIRGKLNELIAGEDKANPLSDAELVHKLQAEGYPVARRTITKYRKIMNIPSSRERKVWGP
ncbi:MAG: RNA polymerase sigma-54 factor [Gemmataceae bacterium]|nr:RNA polymerase sigma-54 factor [Gemmataceae bacterium]